ncbi:beta family protein [Acinetobacter indicus]|uniref:beta family protein n=1 Tax=Acinetobacter indicus TaxID=756892 RepID=UPI00148FA50B|nr:beta family protein [Acinetobacter indicus]
MISFSNINYIPLLSLKPAEMAALEELPKQDKDILLPLIALKKWVNSKTLDKSFARVDKAIGNRVRLFDLDRTYLRDCQNIENPSNCELEYLELANSENGYKKWVELFQKNQNFIPVIQLEDLQELESQLDQFIELCKPIVIRFEMSGEYSITKQDFNFIIKLLLEKKNSINEMLLLLDYGDFTRTHLLNCEKYSEFINKLNAFFPRAYFSISGTSFPYQFLGATKGEIPIYERQIFNKVQKKCENVSLIYSDRASARAERFNGGGGVPPPRIDYALKNDWRFVRKELVDGDEYEKERLYKQAACEVIASEYWIKDLHLWGTQMIEKTALGDGYAITSPSKATAVRINLHLYQQLHYCADISLLDTDEDWED